MLDILSISKCYVINLDRRKDRMILINHKLNELNIEYERISAINGEEYEKEYKKYLDQFTEDEINNKLIINSLGAYGLLMTYKNKISTLYNNNKSSVLILEDDICFHKDFEKILEKRNIINRYDVIWLGCQQVRWKEYMINSSIKTGYYLSDTEKYYIPWGTYGMIYSPYFLKLLHMELKKDINTKNIRNIDIYLSILIKKYNLKSIILNPNMIIPQLEESDNTNFRDINLLKKERKWDLSLYKYLNITSKFKKIYDSINKNKLSLRNENVNRIDNDITNLEISKMIENKKKKFCFYNSIIQ